MSDEKPEGYGTPGPERSANGLMVAVLITTAFMCVGSIGGAGWFAWRATQNVIDREREAAENQQIAQRGRERAGTRGAFEKLGRLLGDGVRGSGGIVQNLHDAQGRPLLSWRVMLLAQDPEARELFELFKLDEAWDSPSNRKLLERRPDFYAPPSSDPVGSGMTYMRAFTFDGSAFGPPSQRFSIRSSRELTAGLSQVLVVYESSDSIEWTKPDDLDWRSGQPRPRIGGPRSDRDDFLAIAADGRVHEIQRTLPDNRLRALFEIREDKRQGIRLTVEKR